MKAGPNAAIKTTDDIPCEMWSKHFPAGHHTLRRSLATEWGYAYIIQLKPGEPEDPFTTACHEDGYPWFETIKPVVLKKKAAPSNTTNLTKAAKNATAASAVAFLEVPPANKTVPKLSVMAEAPILRIPLMDGVTTPGYPMRRICKCKDGYRGDGVIACNPVDGCKRNHGGCASSATCESIGPNVTKCTCPRGFNGDGTVCIKNKPCRNKGACAVNAQCFDEGDGIHKTCACPAGFTGDGTVTGSGCTDVNPCITANGGCDSNARCHKTGRGQRECICKPGFNATVRDGFKGVTCDPIDHCNPATPVQFCDINARCFSE
jgi:hypothetical protein